MFRTRLATWDCSYSAGSLVVLGTAGRLAVVGGVEVLPLEDDALLTRAKPQTPGGAVRRKKPRAALLAAKPLVPFPFPPDMEGLSAQPQAS